jgi:hypothetical protein
VNATTRLIHDLKELEHSYEMLANLDNAATVRAKLKDLEKKSWLDCVRNE